MACLQAGRGVAEGKASHTYRPSNLMSLSSDPTAIFCRFLRNLRHHLFPCPKIQPSRDQGYLISVKEPPILLAKAINSGNKCSPAFVNISDKYRIIEKDSDFVRDQAVAGDAESQFLLGLIFYNDHDEQDLNLADHWIQRAAMGGNTHAMLFLAAKHFRDDPESSVDGAIALEWITKAALAGNTMAQETLGEIYDKGLCYLPEPDHYEAFKWWRKAAIQGSEKAMNTLSDRYMKGKGVWKNYRASRIWFRRTLNQSLVD